MSPIERETGRRPAAPADVPEARARPALSVSGLSKSFDGNRVVDALSFALHPGQTLGLVGPNGAGKTTTLRTLAGVLPLREGRVVVCGHEFSSDEREAKRRLSWVPEDPTPFDSLTVHEHMEFTAALYGVEDWRARSEELLRLFELTEKAGALGGELSRGMRQKLAFACAWLSGPELLLLDEPLSGLDPRGIRSAKEAIRDLARRGTAVLLSSHLLDLIEELCDRLLILDRGRTVFQGTLAEARRAVAAGEGSTLEDVFFAVTGSGAVRDLDPGPRGGDAVDGDAARP